MTTTSKWSLGKCLKGYQKAESPGVSLVIIIISLSLSVSLLLQRASGCWSSICGQNDISPTQDSLNQFLHNTIIHRYSDVINHYFFSLYQLLLQSFSFSAPFTLFKWWLSITSFTLKKRTAKIEPIRPDNDIWLTQAELISFLTSRTMSDPSVDARTLSSEYWSTDGTSLAGWPNLIIFNFGEDTANLSTRLSTAMFEGATANT